MTQRIVHKVEEGVCNDQVPWAAVPSPVKKIEYAHGL